MRIRVGCEFVWETTAPVPMLMLVRPRADADHLTVYESTWSEPDLPIHEYTDLHGNNCWRFLAPTGTSAIRYDAVVEIPSTPDPVVPDAALHNWFIFIIPLGLERRTICSIFSMNVDFSLKKIFLNKILQT